MKSCMAIRQSQKCWPLLLIAWLVMGCDSNVCTPTDENPDACWCPGFQGESCDEVNPQFGSTWMQWIGENEPGWTSLRLRDISMPLTHDAASGYLKDDGSNITAFGTDGDNSLVESVPEFLSGWAKTQSGSLMAQLEAGVRGFDLRMVLNEEGGPTFHHGDVYWDTLALPVFEEMREFLLENPQEILIFSMINFAGSANDEAGHRIFVQSLYEVFGDLIIPAAMDAPARTLDEIYETSGRLMVLYERGGDEGFWEHEGAANLYPIDRAYSNYDVSVNTGDRLDTYLDQEVVVPVEDVKFIQAHLQYSQEVIQSNLATYIEGYTQQEMANERVLAWMQRHRDNPDGAIRIVDFDYFEHMAVALMEEFAHVNRAIYRRTQ